MVFEDFTGKRISYFSRVSVLQNITLLLQKLLNQRPFAILSSNSRVLDSTEPVSSSRAIEAGDLFGLTHRRNEAKSPEVPMWTDCDQVRVSAAGACWTLELDSENSSLLIWTDKMCSAPEIA